MKPTDDAGDPGSLKGSEQHHPLKSKPGEAGAPDHNDGSAEQLTGEIARTVDASDAQTSIADKLRALTGRD